MSLRRWVSQKSLKTPLRNIKMTPYRASFLCELIQYAVLDFLFQKNLHHNHCIWMACFLHELIQYVFSEFLFVKELHRKHYILMASFLHGLIQYAYSKFLFEKKLCHNHCICVVSFLHELFRHFVPWLHFVKYCWYKLLQVKCQQAYVNKVSFYLYKKNISCTPLEPSYQTTIFFFSS